MNLFHNKYLHAFLVAIAIIVCLVTTIIIDNKYHIDIAYTHIYYIPIVMAGVWFHKRAFLVALLFSTLHIWCSYTINSGLVFSALFRSVMFIVVGLVVGILSQNRDALLIEATAEKHAKNKMEETLLRQEEFLYLITHELKTPIAVISSAIQTLNLLYSNQLPAKVDKIHKTIKQNTNRQIRLVNNLLDVTKLKNGNITVNQSVFDINLVVQSIVESVQIYASFRNINIIYISSFSYKEIYSDEEKIERIILNLLSNALKFTPSGSNVYVFLSNKNYCEKKMICISVKDEGLGIPKEKQEYIFEIYGQVDSSLSRSAEGIGLGLYLVNLMVKTLHGEIILESEVGRGSEFSIMLPDGDIEDLKKPNDYKDILPINTNHRIVESISIEFSDIY